MCVNWTDFVETFEDDPWLSMPTKTLYIWKEGNIGSQNFPVNDLNAAFVECEHNEVCAPATAIFSIDTDVCSTGHSQSQEYANERAAWINPRCVQVPEISHEF